jgi:hypothetical protein
MGGAFAGASAGGLTGAWVGSFGGPFAWITVPAGGLFESSSEGVVDISAGQRLLVTVRRRGKTQLMRLCGISSRLVGSTKWEWDNEPNVVTFEINGLLDHRLRTSLWRLFFVRSAAKTHTGKP